MPRLSSLSIATLLLVGVLAGCSSTPDDPTAHWSADKIYSEARDEMNGGAWNKAVPLLEKL